MINTTHFAVELLTAAGFTDKQIRRILHCGWSTLSRIKRALARQALSTAGYESNF